MFQTSRVEFICLGRAINAALRLFYITLMVVQACNVCATPTITKTLQAGAASIEITPPLGEMVVGGFIPFPADRIHDPLFAKCIVLDDGKHRIAIVICDNLGIRREEFDAARKIIAKDTKIQPDQILMAATHTHSATRGQSDKYRPLLIKGIADAVHQAVANMEPAQIGWGSVDEPTEVFNRRWYVGDPALRHNPFGGVDKVRMNPPRAHGSLQTPAGPIDPEISFLSIQALDGTQLALLANYSLHYVGGVKRGEISADYFGLFASSVTRALGSETEHPAMVGILSNGTSGDINNINFRERNGRRWEPYEKMQQVAERVASRVLTAHETVKHHRWLPIASKQQELKLEVRKPSEKMKEYLATIMKVPDDASKHHPYEKIYAERVAKLDSGPDRISIPLQCVQIGDLAILGIPFETFAEIGLNLKAASPFDDTFTIELANDSRGYLPTPRQHALGGYETWMGTNRVEIEASEKITQTLLDMLASMKSKTDSE